MTRQTQFASVARRLAILPCAIVAFAWPAESSAQPAVTDVRFEQIATVVSEKIKEYGVPGVALGIYSDGKSLTRGFGVTSVENPLPVTESTLFQVGSITKTFTGTAVMRLVEQGKLKLDAPVRGSQTGGSLSPEHCVNTCEHQL